MWGVMDAVDPEAVVQGEAGGSGGEQSQLQAFAGGLWRAGLAHQAVRSQLLHENVTTLLLQLQVARRRQSLFAHCQHLLKKDRRRVHWCYMSQRDRRDLMQVLSCLTSHPPWCVWVFSVRVQSGVGVSSWAQWGNVRTTGRFSSIPDGPQLTTGLSTVWLPSEGSL